MFRLWGVLLWCVGLLLSLQSVAWDVRDAKMAWAGGKFSALQRMAADSDGHLLGSYVQYWWLLSQLRTIDPAVIDKEMQKNPGTWVTESLRRAWIHELLRRHDWNAVLQQTGLLNVPYAEGQCAQWQARLQLGQEINKEEVLVFWQKSAGYSSTCLATADLLWQHQAVTETQLWQRMRLDFDYSHLAEAQHWAALLNHPISAQAVSQLQAAPGRFFEQADFSRRQVRELGLYALGLLARHDLEAALQQVNKMTDTWPVGAVQHAFAVLAVQATLQHDRRAYGWFQRAEPLSEVARVWELRAALRLMDWSAVQHTIMQMSATSQQERMVRYWLARAELKNNQTEAAQARFAELATDDDFYGLLARNQLGPLLLPTHHADPDPALIQAVRTLPGIRRALALREAGLRMEAFQEWNWTVQTMDDAHLLAAAEVANREAWYDRAIYTAEKTQNSANLHLRYLMPYQEVLASYTHE